MGGPENPGVRAGVLTHRAEALGDLPGNEEAVTVCHTGVIQRGHSAGLGVFFLPATAFWALEF